MAIKMRECKDKESKVCRGCGEDYAHSLEMYDVMIGDLLIVLCDRCSEEMLKKCCSASCKHNAKVKSQADIKKANAVERYRTRGK